MGVTSSKTSSKKSSFSMNTKFKKDSTIQTILQTKHFRFALLMYATQAESDRIQERWQDFTGNTKDEFIYHTGTKHPQQIKVARDGDKMYFTQSTTIEIDDTDVQNLTKMFNNISETIKETQKNQLVGLIVTAEDGSKGSSLNLLVTDKSP
jgi:hypothetical protein